MRSKIITLLVSGLLTMCLSASADTIPSGYTRAPEWRIGAVVSPAFVPPTSSFLNGNNPEGKIISSKFAGALRAEFTFNPSTREGMLYPDLYQGVGVGGSTFFAPTQLGTPVSIYVYQGAPVFRFSQRLWLGYEWQFGAALGWKHYNRETAPTNAVIGSSATAHMGLSVKLHYSLSPRWRLNVGVDGTHFSNGNTSWPNSGVNSLGASLGVAYVLNQQPVPAKANPELEAEADRGRWFYDIVAFGAWRRRVVRVGNPSEPQLCPGRFGVVGMQFAPLLSLNRWVAVGPALDMQWDESAGLAPYWIDGSLGDYIMFERPPFSKQVSVGISAHAEFTMPIFSVNAGLGYDIINPQGEKRFYQSLTLKTFVTRRLYLNVGYRLGNFNDPQNLLLGLGYRL